MTSPDLSGLIERVEAGTGPCKALDREIALATGWHRYSPSEIGRKSPGWIAPEDFIGEYLDKDGRRIPKLDSLHGTYIWREPRAFTASLDAAMTLVSEGRRMAVQQRRSYEPFWVSFLKDGSTDYDATGRAATLPLAIVAASLRAQKEQANG